jgi:hypothetical protein
VDHVASLCKRMSRKPGSPIITFVVCRHRLSQQVATASPRDAVSKVAGWRRSCESHDVASVLFVFRRPTRDAADHACCPQPHRVQLGIDVSGFNHLFGGRSTLIDKTDWNARPVRPAMGPDHHTGIAGAAWPGRSGGDHANDRCAQRHLLGLSLNPFQASANRLTCTFRHDVASRAQRSI